MALADDLVKEIADICNDRVSVSYGWSIPSTEDITFGNQGKQIRLVSLFVDIRKSTRLVNALGLVNAAKMYKIYTRGVTKIIKARGGDILSFNGDGIVGGFVGSQANNAAILAGLNINWFLYVLLKPRVDTTLGDLNVSADLRFDFGIGIDSGTVLVVKAGMTGEENHDLIWAGNPVNYSVKVASQASMPYALYVSDEVFNDAHFSLKGANGVPLIWDAYQWAEKNKTLWRTDWYFDTEYLKEVPPPPPLRLKGSILDALKPKPKPDPGLQALMDILSGKTK